MRKCRFATNSTSAPSDWMRTIHSWFHDQLRHSKAPTRILSRHNRIPGRIPAPQAFARCDRVPALPLPPLPLPRPPPPPPLPPPLPWHSNQACHGYPLNSNVKGSFVLGSTSRMHPSTGESTYPWMMRVSTSPAFSSPMCPQSPRIKSISPEGG